MTARECSLGGECRHECTVGCKAWSDRARVIADGQEQPTDPVEAA